MGAELAEPALKMIISRQNMLKRILITEMRYVLDVARRKKLIDEPGTFDLSFSRPSMRDLQRLGPALARLSQFLTSSREDQTLSREEARAVVVSQINQLALTDAPLSVELPVGGISSPSDDDDGKGPDDDEDGTTIEQYKETLL